MGKGDIKTRRGKFFAGSYGRLRPRKKVKHAGSSNVTTAKKKENRNTGKQTPVQPSSPESPVKEDIKATAGVKQKSTGPVKKVEEPEAKVKPQVPEDKKTDPGSDTEKESGEKNEDSE